MEAKVLVEASADDLRDTIGQLHALEMATRCTRLELIAGYDDRELWKDDGSTSMSVWLAALTGERQQSTKEQVRVAHALKSLPSIAAAFGEGALSWDQVCALTRFAATETDAEWAQRARTWTASQLERNARRHERLTAEQADTERDARSLRAWRARDGRTVKLYTELPADDGATVVAALQRRAEQQPRNPDTGELEPFDRRMADALVELAAISNANDSDPDRTTVVVTVDAVRLAGGPGIAELEAAVQLRLETIRRMVCDGRIEFAIRDEFGCTVGIGRASRQVPWWLERQVLLRDVTCQFPGCDRTTLLHCHHAIEWINLGPTNLNNLVAICAAHHRAVHEKGWRVIPLGGGRFRFVRPDGLAVLRRPPVLRDEIRHRFLEPVGAHDTS